MAAALAVRLGLLQQVSAINLAFFDEPTANLDDQRRNNLADQILDIQGFSQLFVISHDDTFEQDTDHVIHVVKEEGESRIGAELGVEVVG
jgi:exonuclease SbcC